MVKMRTKRLTPFSFLVYVYENRKHSAYIQRTKAQYTLATKLNSTRSTLLKVDCCRNRQQIGNKVDCCRIRSTLLPIRSTLSPVRTRRKQHGGHDRLCWLSTSRPCWDQLCRQCLPGFRYDSFLPYNRMNTFNSVRVYEFTLRCERTW